MKSWYTIQAAGKHAELSIYNEIGGYGITAQQFINQLNGLQGVSEIVLNISSEGGSVQEGVAIFNALKKHPAFVTVNITGWALSIASFIAMAGDKISMAENALLMMHNAWSSGAGDAEALRRVADVVEKATETLVSAYAIKSGKSAEEVAGILDNETWYTAAEALAAGFIDEITPSMKMAASFDASKFNPPEKVKGLIMQTQQTKPDQQAAAILAADAKRRSEIKALATGHVVSTYGLTEVIAAAADDVSCTVDEARARILAHMGKGVEPLMGNTYVGDIDVSSSSREFRAAATDALLIRAGVRISDPSPLVRDVQRMDIVAMAERILSMHGRSTRDMSRSDIIKAAHTTSDFPLLLANTAGKALRAGYENEPATHALWTGEKEVRDFKPQSMVALSEAPNLLEVPEAAEYTHGTFGESAETFTVKTYGRLFGITRQALINDDLGAFTAMPAAFGAASRRLEADVVYDKLLANAALSDSVALFHADHGNLASTPSALSVASLSVARATMRRQRGINGQQHIDPVPRFLIVPVTLETTAEQLVSSLVDPSKSNDTSNVAWVRNLTVVADPRLDEDSITAWYLAASPNQIDGIVRAYLAGQARPYFETDEEFERDVTSIKSRIDLAAGVIDYRALYKNAGA